MKVFYASRTGNVENMIAKLGIEAEKVELGTEEANEEFILITYTDGFGDVPCEVDSFLASNSSLLKGVIVSGDPAYGEAFCGAGAKISEQYGVKDLYHFENDGNDADVAAIKELIK